MKVLSEKHCFKCGAVFEFSDVIDHLAKLGDNRIHCTSCLTRNYVIAQPRTVVIHAFSTLFSLTWLIGALLGFYIIELQLREVPDKVISIAHFVLAFFGGALGAAIGAYGKELLKYNTGVVSDRNDELRD